MQSKSYLFIKRTADVFLSALALCVLSPIFLFVWILDKFGDNKGPVIFKQKRIGKNHQSFYIFKFRSMIVDADKVLHDDVKLYKKYVNNNYKLEPDEDPRVTKLGAWLRKTSVDEIPQFINILQGNMTLVGPRPVVEEELQEYGNKVDMLLSVKPGAMGYWQASGRSNIGYPERCRVELFYVEHASLHFDIEIIFKNILSILKSDGAY